MVQPLCWIEAEELAPILLSQQKKVKIIDVRDEDYQVGNIIGAIHIGSERMTDQVALGLLKQMIEEQMDMVVFHCHYSQVRGPTVARKFWDLLCKHYPNNETLEVKVLSGGWRYWYKRWQSASDVNKYIEFHSNK
jgi:rhodanese-related sulfurtransferase